MPKKGSDTPTQRERQAAAAARAAAELAAAAPEPGELAELIGSAVEERLSAAIDSALAGVLPALASQISASVIAAQEQSGDGGGEGDALPTDSAAADAAYASAEEARVAREDAAADAGAAQARADAYRLRLQRVQELREALAVEEEALGGGGSAARARLDSAARDAIDAAFGASAGPGRPRAPGSTSDRGLLGAAAAAVEPSAEYRVDRELPHTGRYHWPARRLLSGSYEAGYFAPHELAEVIPGFAKLTKAEQHELLHVYCCTSRVADILRWHELAAYELPAPVRAALDVCHGILEGRVSYLEQQALTAGGLRSQSRAYWQDLQATQLEEARSTPVRGRLGELHGEVLRALREHRAKEAARAEAKRRSSASDDKPG